MSGSIRYNPNWHLQMVTDYLASILRKVCHSIHQEKVGSSSFRITAAFPGLGTQDIRIRTTISGIKIFWGDHEIFSSFEDFLAQLLIEKTGLITHEKLKPSYIYLLNGAPYKVRKAEEKQSILVPDLHYPNPMTPDQYKEYTLELHP